MSPVSGGSSGVSGCLIRLVLYILAGIIGLFLLVAAIVYVVDLLAPVVVAVVQFGLVITPVAVGLWLVNFVLKALPDWWGPDEDGRKALAPVLRLKPGKHRRARGSGS